MGKDEESGWRAMVLTGDEVMEGPFYLDKDASDDLDVYRRLQSESWCSTYFAGAWRGMWRDASPLLACAGQVTDKDRK